MTSAVQNINLHRIDSAGQAIDAGARILVTVLIGAFVIVTALALGAELYVAHLSSEREHVAEELHEQQVRVDGLQASLPGLEADPYLQSELEQLDQRRRHLEKGFDQLRAHVAVNGQGFADVFRGLARHTLEGIWFSKLGVASNGAEMLLGGHALDPALVPRLLQSLSEEPAFRGRAFRRVSFERRETERGSLVDFELRSAEAAETTDAG